MEHVHTVFYARAVNVLLLLISPLAGTNDRPYWRTSQHITASAERPWLKPSAELWNKHAIIVNVANLTIGSCVDLADSTAAVVANALAVVIGERPGKSRYINSLIKPGGAKYFRGFEFTNRWSQANLSLVFWRVFRLSVHFVDRRNHHHFLVLNIVPKDAASQSQMPSRVFTEPHCRTTDRKAAS